MRVSVRYAGGQRRGSCRVSQVRDAFGIGGESGPVVIAEDLELPIEAGDVVCFTGMSGSGKSSLLRAAAGRLKGVVEMDGLALPDQPLVDALEGSFADVAGLLATCGLGDAHLMLRTPAELSEGQRYRFRLALAISSRPQWIVADEFSATLDRTLANVIAFNLRRTSERLGTGFLLATTHEDVLGDLRPTVHVQCGLDGNISVTCDRAKKKRECHSSGNAESAPAPGPTGRTGQLGGYGIRQVDRPVRQIVPRPLSPALAAEVQVRAVDRRG